MRPLVILSLALSLLACKRTPTEPAFDPTATLTGSVSYVENGAPVAGARVTASTTFKGGAHSAETRTNAEGHYALAFPGGTYVVSVFAPGATTQSFIEILSIGPGVRTANFQISANGCVTKSGRVVDGVTRAGISGASISFFGQRVVSAADGSYRLDLGCPPRPATVSELMTVEHPGYQRREFLLSVPTYSMTSDIVMQPR